MWKLSGLSVYTELNVFGCLVIDNLLTLFLSLLLFLVVLVYLAKFGSKVDKY